MAVWAEFEEKEFETLANASFVIPQIGVSAPNVQLFSPGQALEKTLGYDFATKVSPTSDLYRTLFGRTPGLPGVSPSFFSHQHLPQSPSTQSLNVFLQYKRPEYFARGHRSRIWHSSQEHLGFVVEEREGKTKHFNQLETLIDLECALQSHALVRYVCPSEWQKNLLYNSFASGDLLVRSAFVQPTALIRKPTSSSAHHQYHRRWTFTPQNPGSGKGNPDGDEETVQDGLAFMRQLNQNISDSLPFQEVISDAHMNTENIRAELREMRPAHDGEAGDTSERQILTKQVVDETHDQIREEFEGEAGEVIEKTFDIALLAQDLRIDWKVAVQR